MYKKSEIGKFGEEYVCQYLEENEYKVIKRNFYCKQGEIDIVAKDYSTKEFVFIEVKTRTNKVYGYPSDAVDINKKRHLKKCIEYYIHRFDLYKYFIRIDVVEVYVLGEKIKINHIKQIEL